MASINQNVKLTGVERFFDKDEIIVSKTDTRGYITYANEVFQRVAKYKEQELLGANHNIVRHPHMPRCVFKLLWDTLEAGQEIFAYVLNLAKGGDHYWVFAHVTPTFDDQGNIIAYHSSRRVPERPAIDAIWPIYQALLAKEQEFENSKEGMAASFQMVVDLLTSNGVGYDEFVFSLFETNK